MEIKQRRNGAWCMEHGGVEAPYDVLPRGDKFTVVALGDGDMIPDRIIADREPKRSAEAKALQHFKAQ